MGADVAIPDVLRRLGIEARRQGREWVALCPNPGHEDRKPSWRIRDEPGATRHGMHHCWPCGFGGTVEDLVTTVVGITWSGAREWLSGSGMVEDKPIAASVELKIGAFDRSFRIPAGVEFGPLDTWPTSPQRYAIERGISPEEVNRWGIGYAVGGRLKGRIVFAKRAGGRLIGFSARSFIGAKPKYLEPESWEGAAASAVFGEQHWAGTDCAYVTEGAINALAIVRALPSVNVASMSGSQLNVMVAAKLAAFSKLVIVSDPDAAGDKLAATFEAAFARHPTEIIRVRLPKGEDAASMKVEALRECLM